METTVNHTTAPSNTKQAKKATAAETMKAIGEAAKAMEGAMGTINKATNTTSIDDTKNPEDIVHATTRHSETKTVGGSDRIIITNLNYSTTEENVGTLLGKFGHLTETNLPKD